MKGDENRNYRDGDCSRLASAIWQIAGSDWQLAIFEGAGAHVVAVAPTGQLVDVDGIRTEADIRGSWYGPPTIVNSASELYAQGWDTSIEAVDIWAALATLHEAGLITDDVWEYADDELYRLED